jgi:NAD(P)-dependent dehydrogenase (short-subunit alcohol dehydrogenase family)
MKLQGLNAIVTGGSQGLGKAIAEGFLTEGANVLICARGTETLEKAASDLASAVKPGQSLVAAVADVSKASDVDRIVADALKAFGRIDVLVNNAGVYGPMGPIEEVDIDEWLRAIEINVVQCFRISKSRAAARSSTSPGGERPLRFRASAHMPPPRPLSCASPRHSPKKFAPTTST